jgi:hypothetical protein
MKCHGDNDGMTKRLWSVTTLVAMCVVVVATAAPTAQADRPVPFKAGESLTYDVSWTTFVTAGSATLAVKERRPNGPGKSAYYLVAEGQPSSVLQKLYHLYYKAESMMDTKSLQPSLATVFSDENGRKRYKTSTFKANGTVDYEIRTSTTAKSTVKVASTAQDPLGAIYILRALPLKTGMKPFSIPVTDSGKSYTMRVTIGAVEQVRTGIGTLPGLKLALQVTDAAGQAADAKNLQLWLSTDAKRMPLKFIAGLPVGSFQLTLSKVAG